MASRFCPAALIEHGTTLDYCQLDFRELIKSTGDLIALWSMCGSTAR